MGLQAIKEPTVDSARADGNMRSGDHATEGLPFSNDQAQTLLVALRNVIIPLVQTAVPTFRDLSKAQMGPEAEEFLVALQKYISSLVQNQPYTDDKEVRMTPPCFSQVPAVPISSALSNDVDGVGPENVEGTLQLDDFAKESLVLCNILIDEDIEELERLLTEMRAEIFNDVPTRLLHFETTDDSNISHLSLITRPQIFSYCAERFANKFMSSPQKVQDKMAVSKKVKYAILSHTWLRSTSGEVTYDDWQEGTFDRSQVGYLKLLNFCKVAAKHHDVTLGWMDTVCINKSSSSELDESIRSMYRWYQEADICITYLAETTTLADMAHDTWFTRGWTLQELFAPSSLKFYNRNWEQFVSGISDKDHPEIQRNIELATTITRVELDQRSPTDLAVIPISRKMQWAAMRQVTRGEDTSYSLMGIFGISMSIAYGEGAEHAYLRFLKEILDKSKCDILDIFNWGGHYGAEISQILPKSIKAYLHRADSERSIQKLRLKFPRPMVLTRLGLRMPVLVLPVTATPTATTQYTSKGDFYGTVTLHHPEKTIMHEIMMTQVVSYNLLDVAAFGPRLDRDLPRYAFVVLNCGGDEVNLSIPVRCYAVAIAYYGGVRVSAVTRKYRIPTSDCMIFNLRNKTIQTDDCEDTYSIKQKYLDLHGMQFATMYL